MAIRENPWAQGMGNLGTALFGSPQDDVAISQAQSQQALRQRRMTEAEQIRQQTRAEAGQRQALNEMFTNLAGMDTGSPEYQNTLSQAVPTLGQALLDEPAKAFTWLRGLSNMRGANPDQLGRLFDDPEDIMAFQETQARDQRMGEAQEQYPGLGNLFQQFGPEIGEWPNFAQNIATMHVEQGIPVPRAAAHVTDQYDMTTLPTGEIVNANLVDPGASQMVYAPQDQWAREFGLPTRGMFQPGAMATPSAAPGAQGGQQAPMGGQQAPAAPTGGQQTQSAPAPQPAPTEQPAPEATEQGQVPENVRMVNESDPRFGGLPSARYESPMGGIDMPMVDGRPLTIFDVMEYTGGIGNVAQRGSTALLGQFDESFNFSLPEVARSKLIDLRTEMRKLDAVSSRPSQWELKSNEPKYPQTGLFDGPRRNAIRAAEIYYNLASGADTAKRTLATQSLDPQAQQELANGIRHAQSLMDAVGEPRPVEGNPLTARMGELFNAFRRGDEGARATLDSIFDQAKRGELEFDPRDGGDGEAAPDYSQEELEILRQFAPQQGGGGNGGNQMFDSQN